MTLYQEAAKLLDQLDPAPVRLIGVSLYNLSGEEERQLSFADLTDEEALRREEEQERILAALQEHYHLDFAGHLEELRHTQTLHRTVEYMRKHR